MLEHVGGVADVEALVAEGKTHAVADDRAPRVDLAAGQLADVGVERQVGRSGRLERVAEVPRPAADVEHRRPGQRRVRAELGYGVAGQRGVEAVRIRLLLAELTQQAQRTAEIRLVRDVQEP